MDNENTVVKVIEHTCEEICTNLCKYHGTENKDGECELIREKGSCPISKLY